MAELTAQKMAVHHEAVLTRKWWQTANRWCAIASSVWLGIACLLVGLMYWGTSLNCPGVVVLYLASTVLSSAVCFLAYGIDKRRAATERWRVSEATLQWLAAFGGWPGALLGQRTFRHKTQKVKFQLVFWLIVSLHIPLVLWSLLSIRFGS